MLPKIINFNQECRSKIAEGINILADAVKVTLGPQGRHVLIGKRGFPMRFTKDGVSVAREVILYDEMQNAGCNVIREVAINTCAKVGDGTTTATVLAQSLLNHGLEFIKGGCNPIAIKRGMEEGLRLVEEFLDQHARPITNDDELLHIATIAANGDKEIGKVIADTFKTLGKDGVVTLEESTSPHTEMVLSEGIEIRQGFLTPLFITNLSRMCCELEDPYILIFNKKISTLVPLLSLLNSIMSSNESLLIIAEDVDYEALGTLVRNRKNGLKIGAIKYPRIGGLGDELLNDIALMTGATLCSEDHGIKLEGIKREMLGKAKKVVITPSSTTIIGGKGNKELLEERAEFIKKEISTVRDPYQQSFLQERLAKLTNGIGIIKVGGTNELELKEKKDRVEDAVGATRGALQGGTLPGGGIALWRSMEVIQKQLQDYTSQTDILVDMNPMVPGLEIVLAALKSPFLQILKNAGESEAICNQIPDDFWMGYDASEFKIVNMLEKGIIDPLAVIKCALRDSVSIVSLLLTTEASLIEENEITLDTLHQSGNPLKLHV